MVRWQGLAWEKLKNQQNMIKSVAAPALFNGPDATPFAEHPSSTYKNSKGMVTWCDSGPAAAASEESIIIFMAALMISTHSN